MTSTPVSLNDESLNGSWIDINSASQIHSPLGDDSPEFMRPGLSLAESVQNLGIISFQVERFLQEAQRSSTSSSSTKMCHQQLHSQQQQQQQQQCPNIDNISDICLSDSDLSVDLDQSGALTDFDWLWDWTSQPEYFTGQEWKASAPKQKRSYCASLASNSHHRNYSSDMMSLLFLTNMLSIIIGAGLTYSILMRRSNV